MLKKLTRSIFLFLFVLVVTAIYAVTTPVFFTSYNESATAIPVSAERLKQDVAALVGTPKPRNYQNLASLNAAAQYIKTEFEALGVEAEEQKFSVGGNEYKNIICSFGPQDAERLIIGAHYDVCDEQDGADDNGSGTAGLLELARVLKHQNPTLKYRVDLVAYTLEEPPYFRTENMGSAVHAKSLYDNKVPVKGMICLEMIGYFNEAKKSQEYPIGLLKLFYPTTGNYIAVVGKLGQRSIIRNVKKNMKAGCQVQVKSISAPASIPGIDFSDHLNYWKYGYRAVMITDTAFYRNKNYHEKSDKANTLDYEKMAEVVRGVYWTIVNF